MLRDYLTRLLASLGGAPDPDATDALPVEHHILQGIPVAVSNSRPDIATPDALARLSDALDLIARHAPRRLRRLRHDVAEISVRRFPCRAAFYPEPRACLIELTFLVNPRHTAAEVAASLVHEGVHARIARVGARIDPGNKAREERLCREAELEFGLAIPGGEVVVERARQSLLLADAEVAPAIDWSVAARRVAEADRAAPGKDLT
jgi:hypothetical protein